MKGDFYLLSDFQSQVLLTHLLMQQKYTRKEGGKGKMVRGKGEDEEKEGREKGRQTRRKGNPPYHVIHTSGGKGYQSHFSDEEAGLKIP